MEIIITGVAGYIGAHIAAEALAIGHTVIGVDNLSTGKRHFVDPRIDFHIGDLENPEFLDSVFKKVKKPFEVGVIHCAGLKFAGESVKNPIQFYESNSFAVLNLLRAMKNANVSRLVFSSSCSVYGDVQTPEPVGERRELIPISPYGRSKMFAELMIKDSQYEGWLTAVSLRYFNVVGNSHIKAHDISAFNLFPNIYKAVQNNSVLTVFGDNHASRDGTCVRDYIHVIDLAKAHLTSLDKIMEGSKMEFAYNLGSGIGYSVLEIIQEASRVFDKSLTYKIDKAREGDPAIIRAEVKLAQRDLGWHNLKGLDEMLLDGWNAWQRNIKVP